MTEQLTTAPLKERILASVAEAHAADRQYMDTHFNLGSAFTHCSRLESYLTLEARAALRIGLIGLEMPSEYHAPYIVVRGDLDNINTEQLEAAMADLAAKDADLAAYRAAEAAKYAWQNLNKVEAGKFVVVVAGRKVAKGTTGRVKRLNDNPYERFNPKVAIGTPDGLTHYTYADNCKVILPTID